LAVARCGNCKEIVAEADAIELESLPPCPKCGSNAKILSGITQRVRAVVADGNADLSVLHYLTGSGGVVFGGSANVQFTQAKPSIILQAVVEFGGKTDEGQLIQALAPPWYEIANLIERDPSLIYQIDSRKWEELIAGWYKAYGFDEVTLTPRSGDLGRDVIAVRKGWGRVRFIDQVKAYKPGHLVTAEEVRALGFVLTSDQNATKGFVTTTSDFAPRIGEDPLIKSHMPYRIELVNGTELVKRLSELAKS
jgi:restriction system protein